MFEALIFDCDGTLADTMPAHFKAWTQACAKHGLHLPEDRFYALGGVPTPVIFEMLAREAGVELDPVAASLEKEAIFLSELNQVKPVDAVVAVAAAHRGWLPMAVATGGMRHVCSALLEQIGVADWFEVMVTAEDVTEGKPHPETFLLAAERLGVDPARCCAYEDADAGVASARAAGMHVVDVRELLAAL